MCSVQEDRTASPGRCRSLREILKVSDDKVTHHFHQKGAFGLNGELHFTPKRHPEDSRTVIRLTNCCVRSVRSVRFETGHVNAWSCPERVRSCPVLSGTCPVMLSDHVRKECPECPGMSGNVRECVRNVRSGLQGCAGLRVRGGCYSRVRKPPSPVHLARSLQSHICYGLYA